MNKTKFSKSVQLSDMNTIFSLFSRLLEVRSCSPEEYHKSVNALSVSKSCQWYLARRLPTCLFFGLWLDPTVVRRTNLPHSERALYPLGHRDCFERMTQ